MGMSKQTPPGKPVTVVKLGPIPQHDFDEQKGYFTQKVVP